MFLIPVESHVSYMPWERVRILHELGVTPGVSRELSATKVTT